MIIRVGASNYKAPDDLKCLDIKAKIQRFANSEAITKLQTEISAIVGNFESEKQIND
jgi:hypothetical protein